MKDLGKSITAYRKKAGITQEHLAILATLFEDGDYGFFRKCGW